MEHKDKCIITCPNNTLMYNFLCIDNIISEYNKYFIEYNDDEKPLGYYLDQSDEVYKNCYESCKTCEEKGTKENHNCKEYML